MDRRQFLGAALVSGAAAGVLGRCSWAGDASSSPTKWLTRARALTHGPQAHWFGYYDKFQFDADDRLVLSNQVDFEHRSPTADDQIRVGMIDTQAGDKWTELGTSKAWGWQQGCMLQWRPGTRDEVLWNDRDGDRFVCRVLNVKTGARRTLPMPIYTVSPDGKWGLSVDFARINNMRPGYGYAGVEDRFINEQSPSESGVWHVDLDSGKSKLLVSIADAVAHQSEGHNPKGAWNYFNHLLINPDGTRFIFLHRWREKYNPRTRQGSGFITRMFTANADGSDLFVVDPSGATSHFIWRDPQHICAYTRPKGRKWGFYVLRDQATELELLGDGVMTENGHQTYVPHTDNQWLLNDTYPRGADRLQNLYLYHIPSGRKVDVAYLHSPTAYSGEWRCDTHPRTSRDGRSVVVDSPHDGTGRQLYLIDISGIVG